MLCRLKWQEHRWNKKKLWTEWGEFSPSFLCCLLYLECGAQRSLSTSIILLSIAIITMAVFQADSERDISLLESYRYVIMINKYMERFRSVLEQKLTPVHHQRAVRAWWCIILYTVHQTQQWHFLSVCFRADLLALPLVLTTSYNNKNNHVLLIKVP